MVTSRLVYISEGKDKISLHKKPTSKIVKR